jgi:mitochondrial fission protein ELM1
MRKTDLKCWVLSEDGLIGTENQCLGVAEALGVTPEVKRIALRQPWKSLSPHLGFESARSFSTVLAGPWPDLLIASGRKSIAASRYIKRMSGGKTFTVQIQDPRVDPAQFDLVCVPAHDPTRGDNVLVTTAAPNRITSARLDEARAQFAQFAHFTALPSPRVAVLIGGVSKAYEMSEEYTTRLAQQLAALDAGLMITASRRTGTANERILRDALNQPHHHFWDGTGQNPYFGMLAHADIILATQDSASMLSEACSTGKTVYMIPMDKRSTRRGRIDKLHTKLQDLGALKIFDGTLESWDYSPLDDANLIASEITKRLTLDD